MKLSPSSIRKIASLTIRCPLLYHSALLPNQTKLHSLPTNPGCTARDYRLKLILGSDIFHCDHALLKKYHFGYVVLTCTQLLSTVCRGETQPRPPTSSPSEEYRHPSIHFLPLIRLGLQEEAVPEEGHQTSYSAQALLSSE